MDRVGAGHLGGGNGTEDERDAREPLALLAQGTARRQRCPSCDADDERAPGRLDL
jgi:hypothetical protein